MREGMAAPVRRVAPRSWRHSWMPSGWTVATFLDEKSAGTEFVTIGVPDDFHAVRVGFANIAPKPWVVRKVIASASTAWNDYVTPSGHNHEPRTSDAWSVLTFQGAGADEAALVTSQDAPAEIIVAGSARDPASGEASEPTWTFTDWVPCTSVGADPVTGMRVLMLRALVAGNQTVTYTNGLMTAFRTTPAVNQGRRHFIGGLKSGSDQVSRPATLPDRGLTAEILHGNHLVNGQMMCLVQMMTRNAGIVGMVCGDSHQAGIGSTAQVNNFLTQCLLGIGQTTIGEVPVGVVNAAMGGTTSAQFFPRMARLLRAVRPTLVAIPAWSFNDRASVAHASTRVEDITFARALFAADQVREAGAVPIFLTPFPRDPPSLSPEVLRRWRDRREAILALRASGELVVDSGSILSARADGALTGTYPNDLTLDNIHPNDAGHAAIARVLEPMVREIAGLPPAAVAATDRTPRGQAVPASAEPQADTPQDRLGGPGKIFPL